MTPNEQVAQWLDARGLDPELAASMGWVPANHRDLGLSVMIPYISDGRVATRQYRSLWKKEFRLASGSEVELWNVDCLKDDSLSHHPLIFAEGACDGLALVQCGFKRTVAVPGWSDKNLEPDRYEPFKRNEDAINKARTIIVAQHHDNAGAAMLRGICNFFEAIDDIRYVTWPKDCNDANDTLLLHGPEVLVQAINGAKPIDPPGGLITGFTDMPPRPNRKIWRLDYPELNHLMAFRSREISLLTGTPGAGKTTFATWASHHLVRANDVRIGLGLFETDPIEVQNHLLRLHGVFGERGEEPKRASAMQALDRNYRLFHRVEEGEESHGMVWLKRMVHTLAARDGCNLIIVDPWNELEHLPEPGESMTNYINFALMRMRQWADKYDIHICLVAHPKKIEPGRRPIGYDVADSAAFTNKPGMGWTIHLEDDEDYGEHVSLTTWKVRSRQETGCRPGRARLVFDEHLMTYRPATKCSVASASIAKEQGN